MILSLKSDDPIFKRSMYYVYILYSLKSHILYYGYTDNLRRRIKEHNAGDSQFTKGHIPWRLSWYCAFELQFMAQSFEEYLKLGSGKAFVYKRLVDKKKRIVSV